jgi:hypothetical protein
MMRNMRKQCEGDVQGWGRETLASDVLEDSLHPLVVFSDCRFGECSEGSNFTFTTADRSNNGGDVASHSCAHHWKMDMQSCLEFRYARHSDPSYRCLYSSLKLPTITQRGYDEQYQEVYNVFDEIFRSRKRQGMIWSQRSSGGMQYV